MANVPLDWSFIVLVSNTHGCGKCCQAYKAQLEAELPEAITVSVWNDTSEILKGRIQLLVNNARVGLILVFCILALVLRVPIGVLGGDGYSHFFLGVVHSAWSNGCHNQHDFIVCVYRDIGACG